MRTYLSAINDLNSLQSNVALLQQTQEKAPVERREAEKIAEMRECWENLGYSLEELDRLNIIHVTGTKGKGSTCAFASSILQSLGKGLKVGLYTSPHLVHVRERIRINGIPISEESFTKYFYQVWDGFNATSLDSKKPYYFRFLTLMAFKAFLKEGVDVAIIEVGIGGRYDCTNILKTPVVCGITSLGLDHQKILGDALEQIAYQKAGIIKSGIETVVSLQPKSALKVIEEEAAKLNAPILISDKIGEDVKLGNITNNTVLIFARFGR